MFTVENENISGFLSSGQSNGPNRVLISMNYVSIGFRPPLIMFKFCLVIAISIFFKSFGF